MPVIFVQCPSCGADVEYREGKMICWRCGQKFKMAPESEARGKSSKGGMPKFPDSEVGYG